jgi:hypothetical protein
MKQKQWCTFELWRLSESGKTKVWRVICSGGPKDHIGWVQWHGPWRRYVFRSFDAIYNVDCLTQIAQFVGECNAEHQTVLRFSRLAREAARQAASA